MIQKVAHKLKEFIDESKYNYFRIGIYGLGTHPDSVQAWECQENDHQHRFSMNVWADIIVDHVVGPYLLPPRLNGVRYRVFMQEVLPRPLEDVPLIVRREM